MAASADAAASAEYEEQLTLGVVLAVAEALAVEVEEVLLAAVFVPHRRRQGTGAELREWHRIAVRYSGGWGSWISGSSCHLIVGWSIPS